MKYIVVVALTSQVFEQHRHLSSTDDTMRRAAAHNIIDLFIALRDGDAIADAENTSLNQFVEMVNEALAEIEKQGWTQWTAGYDEAKALIDEIEADKFHSQFPTIPETGEGMLSTLSL